MNDLLLSLPVTISQWVLVAGIYRWTWQSKCQRLSFRIAMTIVVCWGAIAVTAFALSMCHALSAMPYFTILFVVGLVFAWLSAPLVVCRTQPFPRFARLLRSERGVGRRRWHRLFWWGTGAFLLAQVVLYGIVRLPSDWDSLAYHLPVVDHWIQYGRLTPKDCAFWYVPANAELVTHWLVSGYSGDFWAGFTNLPIVGLLVASATELLILLRVRMVYRMLAITSLLASQVVTRQLISQENDIAVASLFVTAVVLGWHAVQRRSMRAGVVCAIAIGLLAGIKYYALGYAVISIIGISSAALTVRGLRRCALTVLLLLAGVTVFAAFWYVRNVWYTGTPLFPKGFPSLGMPDLWSTMRPGNELSSLRRGLTWRRAELLGRAFCFQAGPSTFVAVLMVPIVVAYGLRGKLTRNVGLSRYLAVAIAGAVGVYVSMPNVIESVAGTENMLLSQYHPIRFASPIWAIATIGWFALIANLHRKRLRFVASLIMALLVLGDVWFQSLYHLGLRERAGNFGLSLHFPGNLPMDPVTLLLLTIDIVMLAFLLHDMNWRLPSRRYAAVAIAIIALLTCTHWQSTRWHQQYVSHYNALVFNGALPEILATVSAEDRLFVCEYRYYPLLRSDRSGNVIRPLYFIDAESFNEQIDRSKATKILAFESDGHWTRSYDTVLEYTQQRPARFSNLRTMGNLHLIEIKAPNEVCALFQ